MAIVARGYWKRFQLTMLDHVYNVPDTPGKITECKSLYIFSACTYSYTLMPYTLLFLRPTLFVSILLGIPWNVSSTYVRLYSSFPSFVGGWAGGGMRVWYYG